VSTPAVSVMGGKNQWFKKIKNWFFGFLFMVFMVLWFLGFNIES